jgi:hypothetical protein
MPTDDLRLEQALHDAAPAIDTMGVLGNVTRRRNRHRRNRRLAIAAGVLALFLVVGSVTVALTRDDDAQRVEVAAPNSALVARVVTAFGPVTGDTGKAVIPKRVELDRDVGLLRAPVLVGSDGLSVASDDPAGGSASHLVRIDGSHVVDVADFKARVLSIAEGEGARWAVTQNLAPTGGRRAPDSFLKKITGPGEPQSTPLDDHCNDCKPVGQIVAAHGVIWVPIHQGWLLFDANGRNFGAAGGGSDDPVIATFGKYVVLVAGNLLTPLDPHEPDQQPVFKADGRIIDVDGRGGRLLVERDGEVVLEGTGTTMAPTPTLPSGFVGQHFSSSPTRTAVTGTVDGDPAIVLLNDDGRVTTVVLEHAASDTAFAWTDAKTLVAVSGGALYRVKLP